MFKTSGFNDGHIDESKESEDKVDVSDILSPQSPFFASRGRHRSSIDEFDTVDIKREKKSIPKDALKKRFRVNSTNSFVVKDGHTLGVPKEDILIQQVSQEIAKNIKFISRKTGYDDPKGIKYLKKGFNWKKEIFNFIKHIFKEAQLEIECIIVCLIYIQRLINKNSVILTPKNTRPIVFTALLLASKVWDDMSMWNVDFCSIVTEYPLKSLNTWEIRYLSGISYNMSVKSSEYARTYFHLRSNAPPNTQLLPLNMIKARKFEALSVNADFNTKEKMRKRAISCSSLILASGSSHFL